MTTPEARPPQSDWWIFTPLIKGARVYWRWCFGPSKAWAKVGAWVGVAFFALVVLSIASGSKSSDADVSVNISAQPDVAQADAPAEQQAVKAEPTVKPASTAKPAATLVPTKINSSGTQRGKVGELIHVGDLDLTIVSVEAFNSKPYNMFNTSNVAVTLTATNARGGADKSYSFSPLLALTLFDASGVGQSPDSCVGCPNDIDSVDLSRGGTVSGKVYFKLAGTSWTEVRYQAFLSSNKAFITP